MVAGEYEAFQAIAHAKRLIFGGSFLLVTVSIDLLMRNKPPGGAWGRQVYQNVWNENGRLLSIDHGATVHVPVAGQS